MTGTAAPHPAERNAPFPTVFGRGLVSEIPNFVRPPYLVVTMADLWPRFAPLLPPATSVHHVETMERASLEAALEGMEGVASVVGLGGGQAIDAAKYFAWRRNVPLHQFPTSLSVDAMFGHRAGVRENGRVRYVGWAVPETVYFDHEVILSAPAIVNHAGLGDALCFFTGVWDWEFAHRGGRCEARWPWDPALAEASLRRAEATLAGARAIRDLTPDGIALLVAAFQWGGTSYYATGWCPRHIEGVEHYVFYALEAATGRKFLHGQAVCLGLLVGALMHGRRVDELRAAISTVGLDVRPEAMGLGWSEVADTLAGLPEFVREEGLPYGIAHEFRADASFVARLRALIEGERDAR